MSNLPRLVTCPHHLSLKGWLRGSYHCAHCMRVYRQQVAPPVDEPAQPDRLALIIAAAKVVLTYSQHRAGCPQRMLPTVGHSFPDFRPCSCGWEKARLDLQAAIGGLE